MALIIFLGFLLLWIFLLITLFACESDEIQDPIIGRWEWVSGSRQINPSGFERLHHDRSETFLVGDAEYDFSFEGDASFVSTLTPPGNSPVMISGTWDIIGDSLILDVSQPSNYQGLDRYKRKISDENNLDLQWTVEYLEFTDVQIEEWRNRGILTSMGYTVDKDSLLNARGTLISSVLSLHFEKAEN